MGDITVKFTGHGNIRKALTSLYFERNAVYEAFTTFISQKSAELQNLQKSIELTNYELFDAIHQMMQGQVSTWTGRQVEEKLSELCIEYRAVAILNEALNVKRKSIKLLSDDISNAFEHMKVPGTVIEKLGYDWIPALKAMVVIANTQWSKIEIAEREKYTELLRVNAQKVWGFVSSSKPILSRYMEMRKYNCTEEELDDIYKALKTVSYNSSAADFDSRIDAQLNKITYNRNKVRILKLWEEQSGFESVALWCANYAVPIQWVVGDEALLHIRVLKAIQDGKVADAIALHNATQYFEMHHISVLKDKEFIRNCFIDQLGESYRSAFESSGAVLVSRLKTNAKLTSDVFSWENKIGEIRKTIDEFLRDRFCGEAKKKIKSMPEDQLRDKVVQLLDENPDLYTLFIK